MDYAVNKGVLIVAASGNEGGNMILYPAAYSSVLAVGSVNSINQRSGFSSFGPKLDLVAPGESVYSTLPEGYGRKTGTSMSAPYVSGLAAVLWGLPGNGSAAQVEAEMEQNAQDLGIYGRDDEYGFGLIRMDSALRGVLAPETATPIPTSTSLPATETKSTHLKGISEVITATASVVSTLQPANSLVSTIQPSDIEATEISWNNPVLIQYANPRLPLPNSTRGQVALENQSFVILAIGMLVLALGVGMVFYRRFHK